MPNSSGPLSGNRKKLTNQPRERGRSPPQRAIRSFDEGDLVHLDLDPSVHQGRFPPKFVGLTGKIVGRQGDGYKVQVKDGGAKKTVVTIAAHLRPQE